MKTYKLIALFMGLSIASLATAGTVDYLANKVMGCNEALEQLDTLADTNTSALKATATSMLNGINSSYTKAQISKITSDKIDTTEEIEKQKNILNTQKALYMRQLKALDRTKKYTDLYE